eukprot:m.98181 g.98181  ORF g.98181 m.98181 type:complete len:219 (+) comp51387_c0_seq2:3-659(+)
MLLLLAAIAASAFALEGVDISEPVSASSFSCLKSHGYDYVIVRAFRSLNEPDTAAPASINAAWAGGLGTVDIYMFPDPTGGDPAGQVDNMLSYLSSHGIHQGSSGSGTYGMVWLDIEGPQYWSTSTSTNQQFFQSLVSELKAKGQNIGVYTSDSQWVPIFGSKYTGGSSLPLWYAHYDNNPSFSDFTAFAGWTKPTMKQYNGNTNLCSTSGLDLDYHP